MHVHSTVTHFAYTCCSTHRLLNVTSLDSISGGLDYDEPNVVGSGSDITLLNCSYSQTVLIPAGDSGGSGMVAIIDDAIYEGQEEFFLDLGVTQSIQALRILEGSPLRATVQIEDDDGEIECFTIFTSPSNH